MYELTPMEIAGSGMRAQNLRMGVIASNLANARTSRTPEGGPYQVRTVVTEAVIPPAFQEMLARAHAEEITLHGEDQRSRWLLEQHLRGVIVPEILQQPDFVQEYDPSHPDSDPVTGFVQYPNISVISEMTDMISASRNYEANLAVIKNTRDMVFQLLELLRS